MAFFRAIGSHCSSVIDQKIFSMFSGKRLAHGNQIFAGIKAGGNFANIRTQSFLITKECRARDRINLGAGIIDVVFLADVIARHFQKCGQGIAKYRAAAMADMQWSGWIGRDILNVCLDAFAQFGTSVVVTLLENCIKNLWPESFLEVQIDEARPGNFGGQNIGLLCQPFCQSLGQHFRRHAGGLGHHHGGIGRHVAMGGIARRFRCNARNIKAGGQFTWLPSWPKVHF